MNGITTNALELNKQLPKISKIIIAWLVVKGRILIILLIKHLKKKKIICYNNSNFL